MNESSQHTIAIVDDDFFMREVVSEILIEEGYKIESFMRVNDAEKFLLENPVSLLLLDVTMPEEDGYSFLKRLKQNPRFTDLPVIFMTGKGDINDKVHGFELGAVDYIVKPFHRMDILMRVKAHIKIVESQNFDKAKLSQLKEAHRSLMPLPEDLPDAGFAVHFNSFLEAGGDFYEVLKVDDEHFAYFIADISGHDISTSYVMPAVKALMKQCFKESSELQAELKNFNNSVKESIPDGKFITAALIVTDKSQKSFAVINMGHLPVILLKKNGEAEFIEVEGDVLGVHEEPEFGLISRDVEEGDRIIIYTDGLLESSAGKVWAGCLEELKKVVLSTKNLSLESMPKALAENILKPESVNDDVLIVAIEI